MYWKDVFGNLNPFYLQRGCSARVKLMFRRKQFYLSYKKKNVLAFKVYITLCIASMSADFERVLTGDDRIGRATGKIKHLVLKGGRSITSQSLKKISATPSAHVFNTAVPSLETVISREALWTCCLTLRIERNTYTGNPRHHCW